MSNQTSQWQRPFELVYGNSSFDEDYCNITDTEGRLMLHVAPDERSIAAAKLLIKLANSSDSEAKKEASGWQEAIGPMYLRSHLEKQEIENIDELVTFTTTDGHKVYPGEQFSVDESGVLVPRRKAIIVWNELLQPLIDQGEESGWGCSILMFQRNIEGRSRAELIEENPENLSEHREAIVDQLRRWRQ